MLRVILVTILLQIFSSMSSFAQVDTTLTQLQNFPKKYIATVDKKITVYTNRITGKTEKTLTKLAKWESKIQKLLQKVSPETAQRLFANPDMTFAGALQKYKQGISITEGYKAKYDAYTDGLTTQLKYLGEKEALFDKKYLASLKKVQQKDSLLDEETRESEAMQKFIRQRKAELMQQTIQYIGKSKYLQKINKESFYYVETLRNYEEMFKDKKKAEETVVTILNKIPAFQKFTRQNSMLASLFPMPGSNGSTATLAGLQTRASVNNLIQSRIASGGPNAMAQVQQNIQAAQAQLNELKDKILKAGGSNGDAPMPDFKPNMQKTKTFKQRLEFSTTFQPEKNNRFMPGALNLGIGAGYKLNDKSTIGLGIGYMMGLGRIEKINITHEGVSLRSFVDWKLKRQYYMSGGYELNHFSSFKKIEELKTFSSWQQAGLVGVSKKVVMKSKFAKATQVKLLYDFLWRQHVPVSKAFIFRIGLNLK